MKVLAIIAEYYPLHNGHLYQFESAKAEIKPDFSIAIISGNFTQRGEPALLSKWQRADLALRAGFDLVLELPAVFACNSSEYFAKGAIEILGRLGVVSHLSFGSESGKVAVLAEISKILVDKDLEISTALRANAKSGISFFEARRNAIQTQIGEHSKNILQNSNNILAIEYLKQLYLQGSSIIPHTVKRKGGGYNSEFRLEHTEFLSASAIREVLSKQDKETAHKILSDFVPEYTLDALSNLNTETFEEVRKNYFTCLASIVLNRENELSEIFAITEGLENRIIAAIRKTKNLQDLKEALYSKRYAKSRIQRALTQSILGITKKDMKEILQRNDVYYARILGFRKESGELLKKIKKNKAEELSLISNLSKEINSPALKNNPILKFDIKSGNFYSLLNSKSMYESSDLVKNPIIY